MRRGIHEEIDMRFQAGSTPQGAQQGDQGQMNQGDSGEKKQWPFKAIEYPPDVGQLQFTMESVMKEEVKRRRRKSTQQVG